MLCVFLNKHFLSFFNMKGMGHPGSQLSVDCPAKRSQDPGWPSGHPLLLGVQSSGDRDRPDGLSGTQTQVRAAMYYCCQILEVQGGFCVKTIWNRRCLESWTISELKHQWGETLRWNINELKLQWVGPSVRWNINELKLQWVEPSVSWNISDVKHGEGKHQWGETSMRWNISEVKHQWVEVSEMWNIWASFKGLFLSIL